MTTLKRRQSFHSTPVIKNVWLKSSTLSVQNTEYKDKRDCLEKIKPLAVILQPPMTQPMIEQVEHVARLFPSSVGADSLSLAAELENFVTETEETYILQMPQTSVHWNRTELDR